MSFDELIHAPNRLKICAFLDRVNSAEFSVVRDMLGVADSVLSKQVRTLEEAGYLKVSKPRGHGRVRTWLTLTRQGARAYHGHVAALEQLVWGEPGARSAAADMKTPRVPDRDH